MTNKQFKDEELKQVSGGIKEYDEQLVNSNGERVGVINICLHDLCHFDPSRWVKRQEIGMCSVDCGSCKYNEHPGWVESTCNADVEQQ